VTAARLPLREAAPEAAPEAAAQAPARAGPPGVDLPAAGAWRAWPLVRCLALYRATPWRFALTLGLYAAISAALAWQQVWIGQAIEDVKNGWAVQLRGDGRPDASVALAWLAAIAGVALGRAALQYTATVVGLVIQQRLLSTLREAILQKVQRLSLTYHVLHGAGEMISRTTRDADKLRDALTSFWRQGVDSVFVVLASMGFLFWVDPVLGVVPAVLTLAAAVLLVGQADRLVVLDREVGTAYDGVNQTLAEGVHGVRVIKAFGLQRDQIERFRLRVDGFVRATEQALAHAAWRIPLPQMLVGFGQVWVLGWGLHAVSVGRLDVGPLVSALLMVNLLVLRMEGMGRVVKTYADARSSAGRIWELLDEPETIRGGPQAWAAGPVGLRVAAVTVRPPGGGRAVLQDLSFEIGAGRRVALVGATGSGKSTLAALLSRLVDPEEGRILVGRGTDWTDLREIRLSALRQAIQVVPQEPFLFTGTLAANLRMGRPEATDAELVAALAQVEAQELLEQLPGGLQARLGDRGVTLSGGQRQRICLARALLSRPAILVLDDATSALDALTEARVLARLGQGAAHTAGAPDGAPLATPTVLVISHRRATLEHADRVLLLSGGRIVDQGPFAALAARRPDFRDLMGLDDPLEDPQDETHNDLNRTDGH
jgi:ATP-binding cassette subfamily B protein